MTDTRTPTQRIMGTNPAEESQRRQNADEQTLAIFHELMTVLRSVHVKGGTTPQRHKINATLRRLRTADAPFLDRIEAMAGSVLDGGLEAPEWFDNPAALPEVAETGPLTASERQWVQNTFHGRSPREAQEGDVRHLAKLAAKVKGNDGALFVESVFGPIADFYANREKHRNNRIADVYDAPDMSEFEHVYVEATTSLSLGLEKHRGNEVREDAWHDIDKREAGIRRMAAGQFEAFLNEETEPFMPPTPTDRPSLIAEPDPKAESAERGRERSRQRNQDQTTPMQRLGA